MLYFIWRYSEQNLKTRQLIDDMLETDETPLYGRFPVSHEMELSEQVGPDKYYMINKFAVPASLLIYLASLIALLVRYDKGGGAYLIGGLFLAICIVCFSLGIIAIFAKPHFSNILVTNKRLIMQSNIYERLTKTHIIDGQQIERAFLDYENGALVTKIQVEFETKTRTIARQDSLAVVKAVNDLMKAS